MLRFSPLFCSNRGEAGREAGCKLGLSLHLQRRVAAASKNLFPPPPAPQFLGQSEQSSGCCSNFVVLVFNGGWGLPPSPEPLHSPGPFPAPFCRVGGGWKHRPALRVTAGREHSWKGTEGTFSSSPSPGCSLPEVFAPQASLRSKRGVLQPRARPPKQGLNNCPDLRRVVGRSFAVPARMILWLISQ